MNLLTLLRHHPRYLAFGFLHYFFSFAGQTFFIGLFVAAFGQRLGWDNTTFAQVYAGVTLTSAFLLPQIGKLIDRFPVRYVSTVTATAIAIGGSLLATQSAWPLFTLGLLLVRMGGQGVLTLTGATTIGRFFVAGRGQALSLSIIGVSVAEILLPPLFVGLLLVIGLTGTWLLIAGCLLGVFVPAVWLLIPRRDAFQTAAGVAQQSESEQQAYSRRQVLRDRRFYAFLPAILFPPFFLTGTFLNQNLIAASKGWTLAWIAWCFSAFGISRVAAIFGTGTLVDRLGAQAVVRFFLLPVIIGTVLLAYWSAPAAGMVFMALAGVSGGAAGVTGPALWAELYGQRYLGAIKSMVAMVTVFASAIAPPIFSYGLGALPLPTFMNAMAALAVAAVLAANWPGRKAA